MAVALSQGGEFAYVIFQSAQGMGVMGRETPLLVMVVTLSMAVTPVLFIVYDRWVKFAAKSDSRPFDAIEDHGAPVIIAGFGRFGQIVSRVLTLRGVRFTALEINPTQVDFVRKFGNKIHYGDASKLDLLRAAGAQNARVFVLAIDDMESSMRVLEIVKTTFPHLQIVARARNRQHAYALLAAGVEHVIRETFPSSVSAARIVLEELGFPTSVAIQTERVFSDYDEAALRKSAAFKDDTEALIAAAKDYAKELESLFKADAESDT
jgi:voltage-gated potassium channel Kch